MIIRNKNVAQLLYTQHENIFEIFVHYLIAFVIIFYVYYIILSVKYFIYKLLIQNPINKKVICKKIFPFIFILK